MELKSVLASSKLHPYVESFWELTVSEQLLNRPYQMLPEGIFEIIFSLNQPFSQKNLGESEWKQRPTGFIGGLHRKGYFLKAHPNSKVFGVRIKYAMAKHFLGDGLHQLQNQIIAIEDFFGPKAYFLSEQIISNDSFEGRKVLLEQFLIQLLNKNQVSSTNFIDYITQQILITRGQLPIKSLVAKHKISESYFRHKFKQEMGLSPKEFAKVVRLHAAFKAMRTQRLSLKDCALQFDYFDTSHFIKDYQSVMIGLPGEMNSTLYGFQSIFSDLNLALEAE